MSDLSDKCIELIRSNRITSTEVADALGKKGVVENMLPINSGLHVAGKLHYIFAHDESNWSVHEQIQDVPENVVLFVDTFNCGDKAIFGDLVSKYLILYGNVKGIIVKGKMRDVPDLKKFNFPIWCYGPSPLGCYNKQIEIDDRLQLRVKKNKMEIEGGIGVCDDSGCTIIKENEITENIYSRLELIELQEDIWSYCIDTLKWSTYDTVCLKKYLEKPEVLPEILRKKVESIPFKE